MQNKNLGDKLKLEIKNGYEKYTLNETFIIKSMPFFLYIPLLKSRYEKLKKEFMASGKKIDWTVGMIESPKMFGVGWIGLSDKDGDKKVEGDFVMYKMLGSYKNFKNASKIMSDYSKMDDVYHIYMTDPNVTKEEENITYIIFR